MTLFEMFSTVISYQYLPRIALRHFIKSKSKSNFRDCTPFRKEDVLDCQTHGTTLLQPHYHLCKGAPIEYSSLSSVRLSTFGSCSS